MNPLKQLEACGQSPWLDFVSHSLIEKGELKTLIERDGLKGVTSNPSIFEKAIGGSGEYDEELKSFLASGDQSVNAIYEHLAIGDIQRAADVLKPVYDATKGVDGYISLEVSPYLALDTEATIAEARRLWKTVNKANLMVKVPGTEAGIPAIRTLIGEGININVTLLFSLAAYEAVVEAYIAGLEDYAKNHSDLSHLASVASFFVSRIDADVDKQLDALIAGGGDKAVIEPLYGKVAVANAKLAYQRSKLLFSGPRWQILTVKGAQVQRLLWASTGTKSKKYPDTLYVDTLVGSETVNTMPPATMDAFRDHGTAQAHAIEQELDQAHAQLVAIEKLGISLAKVTHQLVDDGVKLFADAFDKLLAAVAGKRRALIDGESARQILSYGSPEFEKAAAGEREAWRAGGSIRRLWAADKFLWTGADENKWAGWLTIVESELADIASLKTFSESVRNGGYAHVVLLGMGGSSLGPEVLSETFGPQPGGPRFHMLDSTDPAQIKTLEDEIDLEKALFIVSSKSGSTLEPNIFESYFFSQLSKKVGADKAGAQFVAVTDPGSAMEKRAKAENFGSIFYGLPSIGGRYSVLSKFGLVPAAALGIDVERLLKTAEQMVQSCQAEVPPAENPGVQLGVALGVAARDFGRNKLTIVASPGIETLGNWLEQLIAESTGKIGRGLIPLTSGPVGSPDPYGSDRFFAYLELEGKADPNQQQEVSALEKAGHPVVRISVKDEWHIGQEFFRWEIATAVVGSILGIDPFDQPDVEASKIKTRELTDAYETEGGLPVATPIFTSGNVSLFCDPANAQALGTHDDLSGYLRTHFGRVSAGDYVALLAYIERNASHSESLQALRVMIRDKLKAAVCLGFGPRFLHSTGQAYKGGPNTGVFLQLTCDDPVDIKVPDHSYSFGVVKTAQARGDFDVLAERNRRALQVHFKDIQSGLVELTAAISAAIS